MAYLLWVILEDVLGEAAAKGGREEVLSLPRPDDPPASEGRQAEILA